MQTEPGLDARTDRQPALAPGPRAAGGLRFGLLATDLKWAGLPHLARALVRSGARVCVVAPPDSYLAVTNFQDGQILLDPTAMCDSFAAVAAALVRDFRPDLVLPGDDDAFRLLAGLARQAGLEDEVRRLLERSIPPPGNIDAFLAESEFLQRFGTLGTTPPPTVVRPSWDEVLRFCTAHGFPVALKVDGFFGGQGVRRCDSLAQLRLALEAGGGRSFVVQKWVEGRPVQCVVAGVAGRVCACLSLEQVEAGKPNGPSTVLRFLDAPRIRATAAGIFERAGLSGICGVDFIRDAQGRDWLLELNPRLVPAAHLGEQFGVDLVRALVGALGGHPAPVATAPRIHKAALFPGEIQRDPDSPHLLDAHHDVPWSDPAVLRRIVDDIVRIVPADEIRSGPVGRRETQGRYSLS